MSFLCPGNTVVAVRKYQLVGSDLGPCLVGFRDNSTPVISASTLKVKFTLEQATTAQSGSRGIALLFL